MEETLRYFQFTDPDNIYNLDNPTQMQFLKIVAKLKKALAAHPEDKYLIFYCLAGHGMVAAGEQQLLINEYKKQTTFYKMIGIEADIRDIAKKFPNSYQIALIACCREVLSRDDHCGGIPQEKAQELLEIYQRQEKMMHKLGSKVREQFISKLDLDKMKLLAIRLDYM